MGIPQLAGPGFAALNDTPPTAGHRQRRIRSPIVQNVEAHRPSLWARRSGLCDCRHRENSFYDSFGRGADSDHDVSARSPRAAGNSLRTRWRRTLLAAKWRVLHDWSPACRYTTFAACRNTVESNLFLRRIPARLFTILGPLLLSCSDRHLQRRRLQVAHRITEIGCAWLWAQCGRCGSANRWRNDAE